jgi:chemotaxis protein CheY-P-specific phosphatase CheC
MKIFASYLITGSILLAGFCTPLAHATGTEILHNTISITQAHQESIDSLNAECCKDHELDEKITLFSSTKKEVKSSATHSNSNLINFSDSSQRQAFQKYFSYVPNAPPLIGTVVKIE